MIEWSCVEAPQHCAQPHSTLLINCFHNIVASAINVVLRSEFLRILFRITTIAAKQSIRRAILIVLVSLILFLIKLIEPLTSIRKTMPRVLCGQVRELWRVNVELSVRVAVGRHVIGYDVHWSHFVFLFPLHAAILEPKRDAAWAFESFRELAMDGWLTKS